MANELPSPIDIRLRRDVDRATVVLAVEEPLRSFRHWLLVLFDLSGGGLFSYSPPLQMVVADKDTGKVVWSNHGYKPGDDPEGAFDALCEEIEDLTLDGFLRRRSQRHPRR